MLTSRTSVYGLIGDPLEHSISPQIQNAAYAKMGLDAVYLCFRVRGSVVKAVRAAPILGISGLNVTIPYKSRVIRALDAVDELARKIGAVNVIRFGEETAGYNTDVAASMRVLREVAGDDLSGRSALLLGAGGSARAMAFGLAQEGCAVVVLNRTARKSARLARDVSLHVPGASISSAGLNRRQLERAIPRSDVLINATPVGMYPNVGKSIVDSAMLRPEIVVMDLVYNPPATRLLREAREVGCKTIGGLKMLVYQAADSIRIWTGKKAPIDIMLSEAERALRNFAFQQS